MLHGDLRQSHEYALVPPATPRGGDGSHPRAGMSRTLGDATGALRDRGGRRVWRRVRAPLLVAFARLRGGPGRALLVLIGVAVATAMLVGVLGASQIARDGVLRQALSDLPSRERSFRVDLVGLSAQQRYTRVDGAARGALATISGADPLRVTFFRDSWVDSEFVRLAGVDDLADHVVLRSGRLPRRCTPRACEVLQIGTTGRRVLHEGQITLIRVGIAGLRDPDAFGPAFQDLRQYRAQQSLVQSIVLLAPSAASFERLPAFAFLFRVHSWVSTPDPGTMRSWQIGSILERESRAQARLGAVDPAFTLEGFDAVLLDAQQRGEISGQRMILIGGGASALLLGFALVAGVGLRRGLAIERDRLLQRGATRPQVWLALGAEVGTITVAGWLLGIGTGALAVTALARRLGLPPGAIVQHAYLERRALLVILLTWVVAAAVVIAVTLGAEQGGERRRVRLIDVAALGAVLIAAVGLTRGGITTDSLAAGRESTLLLVLPALVCFVGGAAAWRLLGPVTALGERASRRGPTAVRLALLALARAPSRASVAGSFLVVAVGFALFAASYAATLGRGAHDESAFAVPLDFTLSQGAQSELPLDIAGLDRYRQVGPGVRAYPVLRRAATVGGVGTAVKSVVVLGVPRTALARVRWRRDFSSLSQAELASRLGRDGPAALRGPAIPPSAESFRLRVRLQGTPLRVDLVLEDARGRVRTVRLGRAGRGSSLLTARVPSGKDGYSAARVVGVELSLPTSETAWFFHLAHEGRVLTAPAGSLTLQALSVVSSDGRTRALTAWGGWVTRGRGFSIRGRLPLRAEYSFREVQPLILRPREQTDDRPLRVVASPAIVSAAGHSGLLTLDFGGARVRARVVGVASRFPTISTDDEFVIADESRLATALDADDPGTAAPGEVWLSVPATAARSAEAAVQRRPFSSLAVTSRRELLQLRAHDPLSHAIVYALGVSALLALALALLGLWVTLAAETRDEGGEYFELEAQGVTPATLRQHLRIRGLALLTFGIVGGALLGFALSRIVVSLVQVSAETGSPQPPLRWDPGWTPVAIVLATLVVAATIAIEGTVRRAFRGDGPERGSWSLE